MMISPLRILMLYKHDGFVQTQALYSMEAPWLPKSESGTRSPAPHLRQRGNIISTPIAPFLKAPGFRSAPQPTHARLAREGLRRRTAAHSTPHPPTRAARSSRCTISQRDNTTACASWGPPAVVRGVWPLGSAPPQCYCPLALDRQPAIYCGEQACARTEVRSVRAELRRNRAAPPPGGNG